MFDTTRLKGVIPPMVTPLQPDETIDVPAVRRLVNYLLDAGVHGLFTLGATGEFPVLTDDARIRMVEAVVEEVNGRVPVLAGVADTCTARVIAHARRAQEAGADVVISTLPFPFTLAVPDLQVDFFRSLADAVPMPWMIYNVPGVLDVSIAPKTLAQIAEIPGLVGIKNSESVAHIQDVIDLTRETGFRVFQGQEVSLYASLLVGAVGGTPSPSNICPAEYVRVYDLTVAGRHAEALAVQNKLNRLGDILDGILGAAFMTKWPAVLKEGLNMLGICSATTARPYATCTEEDRATIAGVLRQLELS